MILSEFKAWFEGYTEDLDGAPNAKQWKRIKAHMLSYAAQRTIEQKRRDTARALRASIKPLTARQRREAVVRAAIAPIGALQELRRAVEVEHVASAVEAECLSFAASYLPPPVDRGGVE